MLRQLRLPGILVLADLGSVLICLWLSELLRPLLPFGKHLPEPMGWPPAFWIIIPMLWCLSMAFTRCYELRASIKTTEVFLHITLGCGLSTLVLSGLLFFSYREMSRLQVELFSAMTLVFLFSERLVIRWLLRSRTLKSDTQRRIVIVGCNPMGRKLAAAIGELHWLGLHLSGYVDDNVPQEFQELCLGNIERTVDIINERRIDEVILALPLSSGILTQQLVVRLQQETNASVRMVPDVIPLAFLRIHMDDFSGIPLISLREPVLTPSERFVKRTFDVAVSAALLLFLGPLMLLIALLIKLTSSGRVFFIQERIGEGGRPFRMIKFRTMNDELKAREGEHKVPNDPRITRIGRILRRSSLDETPQLWNVLKGDMSLVGPRPEIPALVQNYESWQRNRFAVPQGMTGWWQVNGRSQKPMHLSTEDDLFYIRNYSFWLDLLILGKTVKTVLDRKGAF